MVHCKEFTLEGGCTHSGRHTAAIIPVFDEEEDTLEREVNRHEILNEDQNDMLSPPIRSTIPSISGISYTPYIKKEKSTVQKTWESLPPMIDSHLHLVNFVQDEGPGGIKELVKQMNEAKVERAVLLGMGVCKKWSKDDKTEPTYYTDDDSKCYFYSHTDQIVLDAVLSLPLADQKRFAPLMSGINPTDKHAIKHVKRMYEKAPHLWRGVGELLLRHDDLTNLTIDQEPGRADHPALEAIFDFCAEKNLPVLVHHNCTNIAVKTNPDAVTRYLEEMHNCLARNHRLNPNLIIVWAHCGASRRVGDPLLCQKITKMLEQFPNLHVDISWVVLEDEIMGQVNRTVPKEEWVQMINRFSDRVLIGSDVVSAYVDLKKTLLRYAFLLDHLKAETVPKIIRGNAERIFFAPRSIPTNEETLTEKVIPVVLPDGNNGTFIWGKEALKTFSDEEYVIRKNCLPQQFKELVALNYKILHELDGKAHLDKKARVMQAHTTENAFHHVSVFAQSIEPKIQDFITKLRGGKTLNVKLMQELNDMHMKAVYPFVCSAMTTKQQVQDSVSLQQGFSGGPTSAAYPPACQAAQRFKELWENQIKEYDGEGEEEREKRRDILALLKQNGITADENLIPELNVSAFAQIQNVAKGVGNTIVSVLTHEDVYDQLMDEIEPFTKEISQNFTFDLLTQLPFLVRVVQETLRRYSLVSRNQGIAKKDFIMDGVPIKQGTPVLASWFHTNQDPYVYENPKDWNPDRFKDHEMENTDFWAETYQWTPFGAGSRTTTHKCPAMRTAFSLICFYVAKLLTTFEIKMINPNKGINESTPGASPFDDLPVILSLRA